MSALLAINRSMDRHHLLTAAYIDCVALALCFLMPWTPDFTGYQLPVGLMGFSDVSAFLSGEDGRTVQLSVALPAMLIYLFPVLLAITAGLATAVILFGAAGPAVEKTLALAAIGSGLFPTACLVVVIAFFGDKGYYGSLGLYFAVFVGLAMIWHLTGIGGRGGEAGEPTAP